MFSTAELLADSSVEQQKWALGLHWKGFDEVVDRFAPGQDKTRVGISIRTLW
jgi:hypothetical protein